MLFNHKISKYFFYLFVFFLPWQTRLMLTPEKLEFSSFNIYLSEIFLWLALAFWLTSADLKKIKMPPVFLFFCFLVLLGIAWAPDRIAAFRLWLYLFDGIMVWLYINSTEMNDQEELNLSQSFPFYKRVIERDFIRIFLFSMFIASFFGIWQFMNLSSPSFKWLGLSERGAWNLGDIVLENSQGRFLRAYGPLPHPNIFGGYLAAAILLIFMKLTMRNIKRLILSGLLGGIFLLALFLTFSRSAWLALGAALIYFMIRNISRREVKKFFVLFLILAAVFSAIFWPLVRTRATSAGRLEAKSNAERAQSLREGFAVWRAHPFFGVGAGNYNNFKFLNSKFCILNSAFCQPPHNIFILILSELGLVGFAAYLFLWRGFWKNKYLRPALILFFIIGLFDHYLWSLYAGQMLFWLSLSLTSKIE